MNVGNVDFSRLPDLYESKGFNQVAFAKALATPQPYISEIVNGKKRPSLEMICRFAEVLQMKTSEVLGFLETPIAVSA